MGRLLHEGEHMGDHQEPQACQVAHQGIRASRERQGKGSGCSKQVHEGGAESRR